MKFKKIWIIMIVLIILLTMGVVSASDNVTEDTLTLNEDLDDSKLDLDNDESIALDNEESDNDEIINSIPISDSSLIEFRADDVVYGEEVEINVILPEEATGSVKIGVSNNNYTLVLSDGKCSVKIPNLSAGAYNCSVDYSGDGNFYPALEYHSFNVLKKTSLISITCGDVHVGEDITVDIFTNRDFGNVTFLVGEEYYGSITIENRTGSMDIAGLAAGTYNITAIIAGNENYTDNVTTISVSILKYDSGLAVAVSDGLCGDNITIEVTGPVDATGILNVVIDDKNYVGELTGGKYELVYVPSKAGYYIVVVTYSGDEKYNFCNISMLLSISKRNSTVCITMNDSTFVRGTDIEIFIENNTETSVTLNGKELVIKDGKAVIDTTSLLPGNYTITATTVENDQYNANMAEMTFEIIYGNTFEDLQLLIDNCLDSTFTLTQDYYSTGNPITINKSITIDGQGHSLDGNNVSGIFIITAKVTIKNIDIINGNSLEFAAIYSGTDLNVVNSYFANNTGYKGGAIHMKDGNVTNCTFDGNSATDDGGAIWIKKGSVTNCNFADNTAGENGGSVCFYGNGSVTNCNFTGNTANYGGAVYFQSTGTVANCNFTDNTASGDGGAVWIYSGTVTNCNFINNKVTGTESWGGAVFFNREGTVTNCNFTDNSAYRGGAVYLSGTGNVTNCNFTDNSANSVGGAIWFVREYSIINCTFEGNSEPDIYPLPISDGIITNSTYKYYFKNGYLVDEVQEGATLDFRGLFLGNFTVIINKPVNIISSTADAVFDAGDTFKGNDVNSFSIVDGASSTKVTNLTLINTCLFINGASNVTVQNMTIVANKSGVGSGLGMVAIHTGAFYVTFKNSYIENGGTGEPVLVIGKGGQFVSIDNNIVNITGSSGNILSSNRFIGTGENPQSVYYTNNVINSHVGESAMMYGIAVIGEGNLIENNILNNFKGNGIVNAWGSTSTNNIYRNNIITGGGSMTIATYSVAENNNISSAVTVNEGSTVVANMVNGLTVNGKDSFILNNFINGDVTIAAAATNTTLMDNVIFGNVIVNSNQNTLINNTITSNNEYTIDLKSTRGNYLYGNGLIAVSSNGDSSIKSEDNYNEILDNYPYEADLIVFVEDIPVGEMAKINISINPAATGLVKINVSGRNYSKEIQNGNVYMEISDLTADDYNVTVAYDGNEFVSNSTFNKVFTVFKLDPSMVISVRDISYGENEFVNVTIAKDVEINNLTFSLFKGGKSVSNATSIIENGASSYNFSNLDFGAYILEIKYVGDLKYLESLKTVRFTVSPVITILTEVVIEDNMKISMSLGDANGRITIYLDDELYLIQPFVNGKFSSEFSTAGFSLGNHYISFADAGNNLESNIFNYWDVKTNTYLPIKYAFNVLPQHFTVPDKLGSNDDGIVILSFPTDAKGTLSVFIDGVKYKVFEITGGILKIDLSKYKDGNYKFTFKYSGDKKYSSFTKDSSAKLHNTLPVKIVAGNAKVLYSSAKKYSVTVYSNSGKKLSGVKVTFLINGKTLKTVKTNSKGVASVVVSKKPGSYKITSKTSKAKTTKTLKVTHVLSLKKVKVKRSAKKLVLKATLKKVNGKYIKGKKITFKFNGKKYTAKTNKKGVAKVTIKKKVLKKLKKGKKVKYQATYLKDTVKKSVKIKK